MLAGRVLSAVPPGEDAMSLHISAFFNSFTLSQVLPQTLFIHYRSVQWGATRRPLLSDRCAESTLDHQKHCAIALKA